MQARLAEMEAEKNAVSAAGEGEEGSADAQLEKEATPKAEGEADEAMDDDEAPAAVDARSIYVGNVSAPRWAATTWHGRAGKLLHGTCRWIKNV